MQILAKNKFSDNLGSEAIVKALSSDRGIVSDASLPELNELISNLGLNPKSLMKAKKLLDSAIKKGKNICVYGDYDADGITATAIMWLTIVKMGGKVLPFIPSRTRHGYGLSKASVQELLSGISLGKPESPFIPDLIITVDNGIVANQEIAQLVASGKNVIVTDHHQISKLPNADAIIHTTQTSGAGIAWVVARYLSGDAVFAKERIDLATIGIVADQMPVIGINRGVIKEGLKTITNTKLIGLSTILQLSGIWGKNITTYDINFVIAPRINAVGRIDDAIIALRLLCTNNQIQANTIASRMEDLNKQRQLMTDTAIKDALTHLDDNKITVLASDIYHHGVIGLIAGKIAEVTHKPAIVMSIDGQLVKGSARSISGINVTDLLRVHQGLLTSVGGHEQAAGFSLATSNLDEFISSITAYANENIDASLLEKVMIVDAEIPLQATSLELASALSYLEPYGMGNNKPRFVSYNLNVLSDQALGEGGKHHKITVEAGGQTRVVLWFNGSTVGKSISRLVYTLDINLWRNKKELQLIASYVE